MKKLILGIFLVITILILSGCKANSDFPYHLNAHICTHLSDGGRYLSIRIYLRRGVYLFGGGFADDDTGTYFYTGESIYKYKVYCDEQIVYSYNYDDNFQNESSKDLSGPVWSDLVEYNNDILIEKYGLYKVVIECDFTYEYTGKVHHYELTEEIEI